MQLKVILRDKIKSIKDVEVGDEILCDDKIFRPVKSKLLVATYGIFYRLSNGVEFHIYDRIRIKTPTGFALPKLWESVYIDKKTEPMVVLCEPTQNIIVMCDILIEGNIISPDGIVIKYGGA
jgi:hypothetical protein